MKHGRLFPILFAVVLVSGLAVYESFALFMTEVKITASDATRAARFGVSVSISGDTITVGSLDDGVGFLSGSAYVFDRNQGGANNWGEVIKLTASDAANVDFFGSSVSISGDTITVGSPGDDDACPSDPCNSGSAYVFDRNQGGANKWGQVAKLTASDAAAGDFFSGESISISGDTITVGARLNDDACPNDPVFCNSGSAYVFDRNQGGANSWGQVKKLLPGDIARRDSFGFSVSISGDTIIVSSHLDDDKGSTSGSAYVFDRNQGGANNCTWSFPK